ncbi:PilZ domain-containing protein [Sphingosinicella sp. CPCC 101087]|uniref:PilZ domain-containing protein n=1 Tax=Sphingosinicella sp. CPCC 101087 TaxID=2497754 RepID=UPI00101DA192|nr:PilZ domain-containing protein [Sphingosinicella sp. CPCC 101087]
MDYQGGSFETANAADTGQWAYVESDRRAEPRHQGLVEGAMLVFRGQNLRVPVVNISSRGTMIESDISPRLGETVVIRFDGCSPISAFVRWWRDGRIGLNFGGEMILG